MEKEHFTSLEEQNKELQKLFLFYNTKNWDGLKKMINEKYKGSDKEFVYAIQEALEKRHITNLSLYCNNKDIFNYNNILHEFKEYYLNQFNEDLLSYYNFKPYISDKNIAFSIQCEKQYNQSRNIDNTKPKRFCFFSLSVYFVCLFPQVLGYLFGEDIMKDCMKCTGFPLLNCGFAGFLSPINIIKESELAPDDNNLELEDYLFVFNKVRKFAQDDFLEFFDGKHQNLNDEAYQRVIEVLNVSGHRRLVRDEIWFQYGLFRQWIMNPLIHYDSSIVSL